MKERRPIAFPLVPIPENVCAERRKADFGGYPVAFVTFCVDGMKFALRCRAKLVLLVDGGLGDFGVFNVSADGEAWCGGRTGQYNTTGSVAGMAPGISFALVRSTPHLEMLLLSRSGATVIGEMHLPTDRPGVVLRCRMNLHSQDLSRLRRTVHQAANHRSSALAIAG